MTPLDKLWKMWMEAILIYGPHSEEAEEIGQEYTRLYLETHERLP